MADPIGPDEFELLMSPLGPFGRKRSVVVGVSGGADSLALALLLRQWGRPLAVVLDHGLRPESAGEAVLTMERLRAMGVPALCERLDALVPGADLGARARDKRYAALLRVCREYGLPDLLIAHHAQDQVETALLRAARKSGPAGLAAMPAVGWRADARILRPLLPIEPARLRATLASVGIGWVEDPSNRDTGTARGALRSAPIDLTSGMQRTAAAGRTRRADEMQLAIELGEHVSIHAAGHAKIKGSLSQKGWSDLLWVVSGRAYPPRLEAVRCLARAGSGTLHGVMVRHGAVMREAVAMAEPVAAVSGTVWDQRFLVRRTVPGATVGALGFDAVRTPRRLGLPKVVAQSVPVMRFGAELFTSFELAYLGVPSWFSFQVEFRPTRPLVGAPFLPV